MAPKGEHQLFILKSESREVVPELPVASTVILILLNLLSSHAKLNIFTKELRFKSQLSFVVK